MADYVMDVDAVKQLASMPSREELLAKLMATMNEPIAKFVRTLNEVPARSCVPWPRVRDAKGNRPLPDSPIFKPIQYNVIRS